MTALEQTFYNIPEIVLTYKSNFRASERPQITCVDETHEMFRQIWDDEKLDFVEEAKVLLLNRANRVLGICNLSSGGVTGTVMDIRHVFAAALKANATSIILAHNHPSDNPHPSNADRSLTEKMKLAGEHMGVQVLDHIIICRSGCYSLMDDTFYYASKAHGPVPPVLS